MDRHYDGREQVSAAGSSATSIGRWLVVGRSRHVAFCLLQICFSAQRENAQRFASALDVVTFVNNRLRTKII